MWESGARDFEILTQGLTISKNQTFLDLGCGVGRLLPSALSSFGRVIGLNVSREAIARARQLLSPQPELELIAGNGVDLAGIADASIDVLGSFAALSEYSYLCHSELP